MQSSNAAAALTQSPSARYSRAGVKPPEEEQVDPNKGEHAIDETPDLWFFQRQLAWCFAVCCCHQFCGLEPVKLDPHLQEPPNMACLFPCITPSLHPRLLTCFSSGHFASIACWARLLLSRAPASWVASGSSCSLGWVPNCCIPLPTICKWIGRLSGFTV